MTTTQTSAVSGGANDTTHTLPPAAERPLAREFGDIRVVLLAGARVARLQGSHPTVAAGLLDHSTAQTDPFKRLRGTLEYAMRMFYGDDQATAGSEIRALHRNVKGVRDDGRLPCLELRRVDVGLPHTATTSSLPGPAFTLLIAGVCGRGRDSQS